jgi:DNA-binding MarR family transcriptional regulator
VSTRRAENVLGALSLAVADRMSAAVQDVAGQSDTAASALSALDFFLERPSIDLLRQVLGLTSSGTVRLVDRLEAVGWVERRPGPDARSTSVSLTASGRRVAKRVSKARAAVLEEALAGLSAVERETFGRLAGRVLVRMKRGPGATRWICRLCDTDTCTQGPDGCPLGGIARL